ncbi:MAG: hypothetical protein QMC80_00845 [Thermoplasmatales archaeon]|nr:hypothetical protein [Thermoplasmatales archaeon]
MFKYLLSLLSVLFAGPPPPSYSPPYPPPMPPYYTPPPKKDNTLKIVVIIIIILVIVPIIITIILAGMLYMWVSSFEGFTPSATLSTPAETKVGSTYYYNTTITDITFPLSTGNVNFTVTGHGTIPLKKFYSYYTVIEEYQNVSSGVSLLWVDNDGDKMVSETDVFSIRTDNIDLSGKTIRLTYTPTEKTIGSIAIS